MQAMPDGNVQKSWGMSGRNQSRRRMPQNYGNDRKVNNMKKIKAIER